jgi:glycosyltransferase involved in cell wall biosynthesis
MTNRVMQNDLVSTIIPVYNRPVLLREAVASVLAQTHRPIEIFVVDDGSTDETPKVCARLAAAHPDVVFVFHKANGGPGPARELGRLQARGEFIQYLDSDDLLLPRKFEVQVAALRRHPECGVAYCYTRYYKIGQHASDRPWKGSGEMVEAMFPSFLNERWWDTPTPLYRRSVCDAAGPWSDLRLEEDWEYDCRIAALGTRLVHCREFLVEVRDHGEHRLCHGAALDPARLVHRARAHRLVYAHARRAGLGPDSRHLQRYARELFLLARQCGAAGLSFESRELFELSREACGPTRRHGIDYLLYRAAAAALGWRGAGRLACWSDRCRGPASTVLPIAPKP